MNQTLMTYCMDTKVEEPLKTFTKQQAIKTRESSFSTSDIENSEKAIFKIAQLHNAKEHSQKALLKE
jgi:hypothetical protein